MRASACYNLDRLCLRDAAGVCEPRYRHRRVLPYYLDAIRGRAVRFLYAGSSVTRGLLNCTRLAALLNAFFSHRAAAFCLEAGLRAAGAGGVPAGLTLLLAPFPAAGDLRRALSTPARLALRGDNRERFGGRGGGRVLTSAGRRNAALPRHFRTTLRRRRL